MGVYTVGGITQYLQAAGATGGNTGNQVSEAQGVIDYLNRTGGIDGLKVVPVFHAYDIARAETDQAAEAQAACAAWTQDAHVFAVVMPSSTGDMDDLMSCLSQQHVIVLTELTTEDQRFMDTYRPYLYAPSGVNETRALAAEVDALSARGFFTRGAPVGIIRYNTTSDAGAVNDGVIPALRRHGLKPSVFVVNESGTGGEYANIVLRFRTEGVKEVIFTWTSALLFSDLAQTQGYHPKLALTTDALPQFVQANVSKAQLHGAMGIGWAPLADVDAAQDPGPVGPRYKLCMKLGSKAGQDESVRSVAESTVGFCDDLFFLRDAFSKAEPLSPAGVATAVRNLGSSFQSTITWRTNFSPPGRVDGGASYRVLSYRDACSCFAYSSPVEDLP